MSSPRRGEPCARDDAVMRLSVALGCSEVGWSGRQDFNLRPPEPHSPAQYAEPGIRRALPKSRGNPSCSDCSRREWSAWPSWRSIRRSRAFTGSIFAAQVSGLHASTSTAASCSATPYRHGRGLDVLGGESSCKGLSGARAGTRRLLPTEPVPQRSGSRSAESEAGQSPKKC